MSYDYKYIVGESTSTAVDVYIHDQTGTARHRATRYFDDEALAVVYARRVVSAAGAACVVRACDIEERR